METLNNNQTLAVNNHLELAFNLAESRRAALKEEDQTLRSTIENKMALAMFSDDQIEAERLLKILNSMDAIGLTVV